MAQLTAQIKTCSVCRASKPADQFYISKSKPDGLQPACRDCTRARYQANRQRILPVARERAKAYYHENKEKCLAACKNRRPAYYAKNAEAIKGKRRAKYPKDKPRILAYARAWREKNPSRVKQLAVEWRKSNPDKVAAMKYRRRARERKAFVEDVERSKVWERDKGVCHICSGECDPSNWHLDHVIPLAKGGSHTYANVAVSHPHCNLSKHDKILNVGQATHAGRSGDGVGPSHHHAA